MIEFNNSCSEYPFLKFYNTYLKAERNHQKNIHVISIASYSNDSNEVNSRFVNLKIVDDKDFIFFTNYNSPKSEEFLKHNQISASLYWDSINTQIRMKANIKRVSKDYNDQYFKKRCKKKNALAIASHQSQSIESYKKVKENYYKTLAKSNLEVCPEHWGGYSFTPYYFEFWQGDEFRLNLRECFQIKNKQWIKTILQP